MPRIATLAAIAVLASAGLPLLGQSLSQPDSTLRAGADLVPQDARAQWDRASQALKAEKWADAEKELQAVVSAYPKTAAAWSALGVALEHQKKTEEARQAYERAIEADPTLIRTYHLLTVLQMKAGDPESAAKTLARGIQTEGRSGEAAAYLDLAGDAYRLGLAGAEVAARKAIALDKSRELPEAQYILGLILEAQQDPSAAVHFRKFRDPSFVEEEAPPKPAKGRGAARAAALPREAPGPLPGGAYEVAIPGGLGALAAIARLPVTPSSAEFFVEYCQAIVKRAGLPKADAANLADEIHAYMAAAGALSGMADLETDRVRLSLKTSLLEATQDRKNTIRALRLLGWAVVESEDGDRVEPSDAPEDAPRQHIASALGIDEVRMARTLTSGVPFEFQIRSERAAFFRPRTWGLTLNTRDSGELAEALVRNPQAAAVYAALAAAGPGVSEVLINTVGIGALVDQYAAILRLYGSALAVAGDRVVAPGGPEADGVWAKLAGASPADPAAFLPAILDKDQGRLAAFFFALARGDAEHQRFFTRSADIAAQFYRWYKESEELRSTFGVPGITWRQDLFRDLPLDGSGGVRFPGGSAAWTSSSSPAAEALLKMDSLEGLAPVARLEERWGRLLDEDSARMLAKHFASWRALFPYFEKLPGLGPDEFRALEAFERSVFGRADETRNQIVGEWHSLVKLAVLGAEAGSLAAADAARAFRRACAGLSEPDYSAQALAALRAMTGDADNLDEAVPQRLLRLTGERRAAFDRMRNLQDVPPLGSLSEGGHARMLAALSGLVYAAVLDPKLLLASEDPQFLSKHLFRTGVTLRGSDLFLPAMLRLTSETPGSRFEGGLMNFEQQTKDLTLAPDGQEEPPQAFEIPRRGAPSSVKTASPASPQLTGGAAELPASKTPEALFRANASLVEVYATVMDGSRYIDDLAKEDFVVSDGGQPAVVGAFESRTFPVSVALLLDASGSMDSSLPAVKASAFRLIEDLRPIDSVAVYCFNSKVAELQPLTRDKDAAKRAVLKVSAGGATALNDAVVRVTRDLSGRAGKKVIVVLTDGADNASGLTSEAVTLRARKVGLPIYAIAHGDSLKDAKLLKSLNTLARETGGLSFAIRTPKEIRDVFDHVSRDIEHGYYFTFQPAPGGSRTWRPIQVRLRKDPGKKVRTREGYYAN